MKKIMTTIPRIPMDQRMVVLMVATVLMVMGMAEMVMEAEENDDTVDKSN